MSGGGGVLGNIAKIALPVAVSFIPGIGPLASAALVAAGEGGITKMQGGSWGDALKSGAMSGLAMGAAPVLGNAFSSIAPETASSLGINGGANTVFGKGFGGGFGDAVGMGGGAAGGMSQAAGAMTGLDSGNVDMQSPSSVGGSVMGKDASAINAGSSGDGSMFSKIPVIGPVLDKAGSWASKNPIPVALGAMSAYSGYKSAQDRQKQAETLQNQQSVKNATDLASWKQTLGQPPMNRQQTNPNINYNMYGQQGPEQSFFTNNQLTPGNYLAKGGHVTNDGEPDMEPMPTQRKLDPTPRNMDPMPFLRKRVLDTMPTVKKLPTDGESDMEPFSRAKGGQMFPRRNSHIRGPGGPTGDKIPTMLSDGEYVIKAKSVSKLGGGNNKKGAKVLDRVNRLGALGKRVDKLCYGGAM